MILVPKERVEKIGKKSMASYKVEAVIYSGGDYDDKQFVLVEKQIYDKLENNRDCEVIKWQERADKMEQTALAITRLLGEEWFGKTSKEQGGKRC